MKTNTPCTGVRSTWWLCDVHIKMNAHHDIVWEHNFLKIAMWRAVFLPPSCYQGTLSTTTGLIRWYQSLPRTCKGCKGHVWEARSWPERPPSQVVDAPSYFFPTKPSFAFPPRHLSHPFPAGGCTFSGHLPFVPFVHLDLCCITLFPTWFLCSWDFHPRSCKQRRFWCNIDRCLKRGR